MAREIIARHKWVVGATITESMDENQNDGVRRFTATIRGWRSFKIYEGKASDIISEKVKQTVMEIRNKIDSGDNTVFDKEGFWL